ncbi:hypothetical protein PR048_024584 [Dryococelus australis]|uniref:Uncharacterized protein n=1 Tax=Dryococelus australis TaxID=614101 RepID=A0ABQ9GNZ1_9NEOP|nr:hypothetical protein PR048_024584 [Dryococelus australis]
MTVALSVVSGTELLLEKLGAIAEKYDHVKAFNAKENKMTSKSLQRLLSATFCRSVVSLYKPPLAVGVGSVSSLRQVIEEVWTAMNIEVLGFNEGEASAGIREQRKTGDPQENPLTSGIALHYSYERESESNSRARRQLPEGMDLSGMLSMAKMAFEGAIEDGNAAAEEAKMAKEDPEKARQDAMMKNMFSSLDMVKGMSEYPGKEGSKYTKTAIVRRDSHVRKSGNHPARNRGRFAEVAGEYSDHCTTTKERQSSEETKNNIQEIVNPVEEGWKEKNFRKVRGGGVFIDAGGEATINKIRASERLKSLGLRLNEPRNKGPKEAPVSLRTEWNKENVNIVLEYLCVYRNLLISQETIKYGYAACKVRNFLFPMRRNKCQHYGHQSKPCKSTERKLVCENYLQDKKEYRYLVDSKKCPQLDKSFLVTL